MIVPLQVADMLELQHYGIPLAESMRLSKENGPAMVERLVRFWAAI